MDELNDIEIGKLLRLKKFEQPDPAYFDNFLHEFHRRQRDEMLRQPFWRVALQRAQDSMLKLNLSALASYPVAAAAVLVCAAVISLKVSQAPAGPDLASIPAPKVTAAAAPAHWNLGTPVSTRYVESPLLRKNNQSLQTHRVATQPRYVLDSLPVSYEPAFRF